MQIDCAHCGKVADRPAGHVNRSRAQGLNIYCSRVCSGLARRQGKSVEERKAAKREYDQLYRQRDPEALKQRKAEYYKRTHDPIREAAIRKERMHLHVDYCRRPEYREWKRTYDRQYRATKYYGEFAECFLLTMAIRDECLSRMSDYEIRMENGTFAKTQQRKRHDQRAYRKEPEIGPLGNLNIGERGQNGSLSGRRYRLTGAGNSSDDQHTASDRAAV